LIANRAATVVALLVALAMPGLATAAPHPKTNLADVEDEVMCTICGTLLELAESPQAQRERTFIRERIRRGETKDEIKDDLVAEYGSRVLALPPASGFNLSAYIVPAAAIVLAAIGVALGLRRWRRRGDDDSGTPPAPGAEDSKRLDADLARYDL
jgi:cytochrome c-type biogenesis protein CcmH